MGSEEWAVAGALDHPSILRIRRYQSSSIQRLVCHLLGGGPRFVLSQIPESEDLGYQFAVEKLAFYFSLVMEIGWETSKITMDSVGITKF